MRITTIIGVHSQALGSLKLYEAKTDMVFFSGSPPNPSSRTFLTKEGTIGYKMHKFFGFRSKTE